MIHFGTQRVHAYWQGRRAGQKAPLRAEMAPSGMSQDLHSTFVLEGNDKRDPGRFVIRLAGTRVCNTFCAELRNRTFSSLFHAADQPVASQCIDAVRLENTVVTMRLIARTEAGRTLEMECLLLPLRDEKPRMIFGTLIPLDSPVWLGSDPIAWLEIDSLRVIDQDKELFSLHNRPDMPVHLDRSEPINAAGAHQWKIITGNAWKRTEKQASTLRVVEGGKP